MRIITAYSLGNRGDTTSTDAMLRNGFAEGDEIVRAVKRPGLASSYTVTTGTGSTSTLGQGLFSTATPSAPGIAGSDMLFAVRGDILTRGI